MNRSEAKRQNEQRQERWVERNFDITSGMPKPDPLALVNHTEDEEIFRHSGWSARREKVMQAMNHAGIGSNQRARFACCGSQARWYYSATENRHFVRASYCRCRYCQPCATAKANRIAGNIRKRLQQRPKGRYRFITLPIQHKDVPLVDQVKFLMACWKKLQRSKLWKTQHGGCWTMEIKIGTDGLWHPHIHAVTEGYFLPQAELSRIWDEISGGSYVVDVRQVRNAEQVGHELSKYIAKGTSADVFNDPEKLIEYIVSIKGTRSCGTFGNWRDIPLTEKTPLPADLVFVATHAQLMSAARRGERWAVHLLDQYLPGEITCDYS